MEHTQQQNIDRQASADAISACAVAIGHENGVVITRCVWDLGQDYTLLHAHRLDLYTDDKTVRLYFPDVELLGSGNETRMKRTKERLHSAIAQLLSRSPAPTYSFR